MGQIPIGSINLIENIDDVKKFKNEENKKLAYITQTTLSVDDTRDIINTLKEKFSNISLDSKDFISKTFSKYQMVKSYVDLYEQQSI